MDSIFIDTSAWLSHLNRRDQAHEAVGDALRAAAGRLVTTTYVFDETVTLARARLGRGPAVRIGTLLLDVDVVDLLRITPEVEGTAWGLFRDRPDKEYSFTDCTSFALMRKLGIADAVTLDADFRREGFLVRPD